MIKATRVALVSDTHMWPSAVAPPPQGDDYAAMLLDECETLHALLLEELAASGAQLVIHLGDMTCGGGYFGMPEAALEPLLIRLRNDFATLPMPVYALPGNHDMRPGGGDWSLFTSLWGMETGKGATVDIDGLRLLLINAQGHDKAQLRAAQPGDPVYGWVNDAELGRVAAALAGAGARPVVAFVHQLIHPWRATQRPWKPFYGVRNAEALTQLFARNQSLCALFQGHAHRYERAPLPRALFNKGRVPLSVLTPAVIEYPVGWLQLDLLPTGMQVTLRQLPRTDLVARSLCDGAQAWRAPESLRQWSATW